MQPKILCIGDIHFPFENKATLRRIIQEASVIQPTHIVQLGDLYDMYSFNAYPGKKLFILPKDEIKDGRKRAVEFWEAVTSAVPGAVCYQLLGNHDERIFRQMLDKLPEMAHWLGPVADSHFQFTGVVTSREQREELLLGVMGYQILFMHGFRSKLGSHAQHNDISTVCGHSHQGGVSFIRRGQRHIWELNAGWCGLGAASGVASMSYTRQRRVSKWTQGFGLIDGYGPRFVCLQR